MVIEDLDLFVIPPEATIRQGMEQINENTSGIVLVSNAAGRLDGTVTDGDIRRAILHGAALDDPLSSVMNEEPFFVSADADKRTLTQLGRDRGIPQIPLVDDDDRLSGLFLLNSTGPQRDASQGEANGAGDAVIMAGGLGTRLRPHTKDIPKPLVEVCGKPILEHIVEHLSAFGVDKLYITTRYLAEQIEEYFGDGEDWGVDIEYLREKKRLGTAGGLSRLDNRLEGAILVMNGDLVTDFNVNEMFRFHRRHEAMITMGVRHHQMRVPYGVADIDGIAVRELNEKPEFDFFVNAGIYIVDPGILEHIPDGEYYDITTLIENVLGRENVIGFPIVEQWMDIGRPEDLRRANEKLAGE